MKCRNPECNADINPGAMFCGKCGTPVLFKCPKCGSEIPTKKNAKSCQKCGMMISEMRVETPSHVLPEMPLSPTMSYIPPAPETPPSPTVSYVSPAPKTPPLPAPSYVLPTPEKPVSRTRKKSEKEAEVNVDLLPKGLTKKAFIDLPEFKTQKTWFTVAGVVCILSGLVMLGKAAQFATMGYTVTINIVLAVVSIVPGVLLLIKKDTTIAYLTSVIMGILIIFSFASGGAAGILPVFAAVSSFTGARKIDKLWNQYQSR